MPSIAMPRVLPKAFADESFAFYDKVLSGVPQQQDRWKRAVNATNAALGDAVGKMYVQRYFPCQRRRRSCSRWSRPSSTAFDHRLDALTWMSPKTKASAKAKLQTLKVGIGYPDSVARLFGAARSSAAMRSAMRSARSCSTTTTRSAGSAARRIRARMVDDAADGQRRQPANPERAELPRRDSRAAVLRSGGRARRADTAPSARSSATRSATASTTRAASSTRPAASPTGGRPRTSRISRPRRPSWSRKYNAYMPFPDLHENGQLTLSENIADVAGLSASHDAYPRLRRARRSHVFHQRSRRAGARRIASRSIGGRC